MREKWKELILYLRESETAFLLFFSAVVGSGAGFGAIIFRWLISSFTDLFFEQGRNIFQFMGPFYVILIPALGGLVIGPLIYAFARETKGHGVPEVMFAVATWGGKLEQE